MWPDVAGIFVEQLFPAALVAEDSIDFRS